MWNNGMLQLNTSNRVESWQRFARTRMLSLALQVDALSGEKGNVEQCICYYLRLHQLNINC